MDELIKRGTAMLHYVGIILVFALIAAVLCVPGIIHFCGQQGLCPPQNQYPVKPKNGAPPKGEGTACLLFL